jgi:hypothetical protein
MVFKPLLLGKVDVHDRQVYRQLDDEDEYLVPKFFPVVSCLICNHDGGKIKQLPLPAENLQGRFLGEYRGGLW